MGGKDRADQFIFQYRPNLRCRRTWTPIFLHSLDVMRVNAFIVAKEMSKPTMLHLKDFIAKWIDCLNRRAETIDDQMNRRAMDSSTKEEGSGGCSL
jgi:hypothetical protein